MKQRRNAMRQYACLIYYDPQTLFGGSPEAEAALSECQGHDEVLKARGQFVLGEALEMPDSAITVRVRDGRMSTTDGPFMETREMLGGIVIVTANDLNDAVAAAATHPLARIGAVEVRPLVDFSEPRPQL
jgi:hypothetical protein